MNHVNTMVTPSFSNAYAGHSLTDGQKDVVIALLKGACERIVGGSLNAPAPETK